MKNIEITLFLIPLVKAAQGIEMPLHLLSHVVTLNISPLLPAPTLESPLDDWRNLFTKFYACAIGRYFVYMRKKKSNNKLNKSTTIDNFAIAHTSNHWRGDESVFPDLMILEVKIPLGVLPVKASTPSSVINNVCSNCAERLPSTVVTVHWAGHIKYFPEN